MLPLIPTYVLYRLLRPLLPRTHSLKRRRSLSEWTARATDLLVWLDTFLLLGGAAALWLTLTGVTP